MDLTARSHAPSFKQAANAATSRRMHRWLHFMGALMLAVLLWTSSASHAAEAFGCVEVSAEAAGHFDGDGDQTPADPDKGVPHHHGGGCHGHHNATSASGEAGPTTALSGALLARSPDTLLAGRGPPAALRPPIA